MGTQYREDHRFNCVLATLLLLAILFMFIPQVAFADEGEDAGDTASSPSVVLALDSDDASSSALVEGEGQEGECDENTLSVQPGNSAEEGAAEQEAPTGEVLVEDDADSQPKTPESTEGEVGDGEADSQPSEGLEAQAPEESVTPAIPNAPDDAVEVTEGTYVLQSDLTGKQVVDAAGVDPKNGANVATWWYNGGDNQKWLVERVTGVEELWYRLLLKIDPTLALTATEGDDVQVATDDGTNLGALWAFVNGENQTYKLISALSGKVLDIYDNRTPAGTNISMWYDKTSGDANQRFRLVDTKIEVSASDDASAYEGTRTLELAGTGLLADIDHGKGDNGANALLWWGTGAINQKMYLEPNGSGYYLVWNIASGKVLDVDNGSILPGANVLQWERNGGDNQLWAIYQASDGTLSLRNKATGLWLGNATPSCGASLAGLATASFFKAQEVELLTAGIKEIHPRTNTQASMDVRQASASSGADVLLWLDTDSLNQRFELVSAGTNLWRVRTASSGGWLTDNGKGKSVTQEGSSSTKDSADVWRATFRGGWYGLISEKSGLALDMYGGGNGANTAITTWDSHGGDSQHFIIDPNELLMPGYYLFQNAGGKYLDVGWDSLDNGANVLMWDRNGTFGEYFVLERYGSNLRIKNAWSGKYITAEGSNDLANVTQQSSSSNAQQQWRAIIADGGGVSFVNAASGKALDVFGASTDNGANVQVYTLHQGPAQVWKPIKNVEEPYESYMLYAVRRANASSSATGYLIVVDRNNTQTIIMVGGNGNWHPLKDFACSVGAPGSPTISGNFTVGERGYSFGHGYTCYYWTQIYKDWLFHSVKYYEGTRSIMDGRLNAHISAGCVRLDINNAYWIYSSIPSGTRIIIY